MEFLSSENKNVKYSLYVVDVFTKYAWIKAFKDKKKGETVLNAFIKIVNESHGKPKKIWVDQERKFGNKLVQEWLDNDNTLMYYTHNEDMSVIAERFMKTLKAKIYKKWQLMIANFLLVIWIN